MENLKEQIFRATEDFLSAIRQMTQQHAALLFQETFSSLGSARNATTAAAKPRGVKHGGGRGAKRGTDELNQLSERFTQFVRDNPGLRIEQINKQLGTTTAALALPIRKLIASGVISVEGEKRATMYFAGNGKKGSADTAETPPAGKKARKRSGSKKSRTGSRSRSKTKK
jgi:hypothetical protein